MKQNDNSAEFAGAMAIFMSLFMMLVIISSLVKCAIADAPKDRDQWILKDSNSPARWTQDQWVILDSYLKKIDDLEKKVTAIEARQNKTLER